MIQPRLVAKRFRRRDGMTTIELLAATTLSALILSASMGVVSAMLRDSSRLLTIRSPFWHAEFLDQFRQDLLNARSIETSAGSIILRGYSSERETGRIALHPSEVRYYIASTKNVTWLLRKQSKTENLTNRNYRTEVVAAGITSLSVRKIIRGQEQVISGAVPMPDGVRITLMSANSPASNLDRRLLLK